MWLSPLFSRWRRVVPLLLHGPSLSESAFLSPQFGSFLSAFAGKVLLFSWLWFQHHYLPLCSFCFLFGSLALLLEGTPLFSACGCSIRLPLAYFGKYSATCHHFPFVYARLPLTGRLDKTDLLFFQAIIPVLSLSCP